MDLLGMPWTSIASVHFSGLMLEGSQQSHRPAVQECSGLRRSWGPKWGEVDFLRAGIASASKTLGSPPF
jgi:hypothetical protein